MPEIKVHEEKCSGCGTCELWCSLTFQGSFNPLTGRQTTRDVGRCASRSTPLALLRVAPPEVGPRLPPLMGGA